MNKNKAVIFDIDGTLADCEHRRHFVTGPKKDFKSFFDAMGDDTVKNNIRLLCNMYHSSNWYVIICTGRPEDYREITENWLQYYGIFYHELRMRPKDKSHNPDDEIKQDMLNEILKEKCVEIVFDDRDQVVAMWRKNGITCLQVDYGNF